jgi:hypothetical protein
VQGPATEDFVVQRLILVLIMICLLPFFGCSTWPQPNTPTGGAVVGGGAGAGITYATGKKDIEIASETPLAFL